MKGRPKGSLNRSTLRSMSRYDMERLPLDQLMFCMEFWREVCDTMAAKQMRQWADEAKADAEKREKEARNICQRWRPTAVA